MAAPAAGVPGARELPNVGARNLTHVLKEQQVLGTVEPVLQSHGP